MEHGRVRVRRVVGIGLEAGKDANLFLASGDVMDPRTEVSQVFIAGREQSLETRHTRLWQQFKDRP